MCKFTYCIVDLHFHILCMSSVNISFHFSGTQERIVNKRIDGIGVMNIDYGRSEFMSLVDEIISVIIAVLPLLVGVDGTERRSQPVEVEPKAVTLFELAL